MTKEPKFMWNIQIDTFMELNKLKQIGITDSHFT